MAFDLHKWILQNPEEYFDTKKGLSYLEELALIAERFGMSKEDALKEIVHAVYITGVKQEALFESIVFGYWKYLNEEELQYVDYNCDGTPIETDDDDECEDPPF